MVVDRSNNPTDKVVDYAYQYYDANGKNNNRIRQITDNIETAYSTTYSYDNYNRLTNATANAFSRSYQYDEWGNIKNFSGLTLTYQTNASGAPTTNRIDTDSQSYSYTYDAAGNMTVGAGQSYSYDGANRLKTASNGTSSYGYDGDGKRVKKTESGSTVFYIYSSKLGQSVMEVTANSVQRAYVDMGGQIVAMQATDGQFYWLHVNHLGSSRALTDSSGNLAYKGQFDPYGASLTEWSNSGNTNLNSKKFTGYERDSATGLDYANARMYNSARGRFMTPDPIGLKAANVKRPESMNRYSYVGNDPINFIDPGGMIACPASVCGGPDYSALWDLWWGRWTMELPIEMPAGDPASGGGQQDDPKIANRKNVLAIALRALESKPDCANLIKSSRVDDPIAFLKRLSSDSSQFAENADIPYPAQAKTEGVGDNAKISFAKGYWGDLEIEKDQNYGTVHGVKFTVLEWMALDVLHELSHATGKFIHGDSTTYRGNTYDYTITQSGLTKELVNACFGLGPS